MVKGDLRRARRYIQESVVVARELGDKDRLGIALAVLAQMDVLEGHWNAAEVSFERALTLHRELGDRILIASTIFGLSMASMGHRSPDRVRETLVEAVAICEEIGSRRTGGG